MPHPHGSRMSQDRDPPCAITGCSMDRELFLLRSSPGSLIGFLSCLLTSYRAVQRTAAPAGRSGMEEEGGSCLLVVGVTQQHPVGPDAA